MIIPELPPASGYESTGKARLYPRYEDITQDGRAHLAPLMTGLTAVWRSMTDTSRMSDVLRSGTVPILSRIVMLGDDGPFAPDLPIEVEGTWRLAHETDGERLFLDMWLDAYAPHMRQFTPRPPADAPRVRVGRVYAEHVITRPFAKTPAERKVTRLAVAGLPELPEHAHPHESAEALIAGEDLDLASVQLFTMMHTDSNQHVNSLVYPRMFEEAAVRRAVEQRATAKPEALLARGIELRYRKPFFAGERAQLALKLKADAAGLRAVGAFAPAAPSKPSCAISMTFA